jgi:hypothetical protein
MNGSDKQIAWATKIQSKIQSKINDFEAQIKAAPIGPRGAPPAKLFEAINALRSKIETESDSSWFIKNENLQIRDEIKKLMV